MTMQIGRDDWYQKHGRTTGSGITLFAPSKYVKYHPVCPAQNGIVNRAFEVAALDGARWHVKLLAIRRIHRLQSPM